MKHDQTVDFTATTSRISACTITIRQTIKDIEDPVNLDLRADLVIQAQELLNEVVLLSDMISKFAWSDLDEKGTLNKFL
jgi:hypothetical protein